MDCPNCGLETQANQKYCRSCGAGLQMTTQPLTRQGAIPDFESQAAISRNEENHPGNNLAVWGFMIMFIGVAIGVIGKMLLHQDLITVIGVLVSLAGMFISAYPYLSTPARQQSDSNLTSQAKVAKSSPRVKQLPEESDIEYVPSITERTTNLLPEDARPRTSTKDERENARDVGIVD